MAIGGAFFNHQWRNGISSWIVNFNGWDATLSVRLATKTKRNRSGEINTGT